MKKKTIFAVSAVLLVILVLFGCSPSSTSAPSVIEIKISENVPPETTAITECFGPWIKKIESRSNGRVKFTMFPMSALGALPDQYNMLLDGTADISRMVPDVTPGVFPLTEGISLPFMFNSSQSSSATYMQLVEKHLQKAEYNKLKILWCLSIAPAHAETQKKHIKTLEDFAGQSSSLLINCR